MFKRKFIGYYLLEHEFLEILSTEKVAHNEMLYPKFMGQRVLSTFKELISTEQIGLLGFL